MAKRRGEVVAEYQCVDCLCVLTVWDDQMRRRCQPCVNGRTAAADAAAARVVGWADTDDKWLQTCGWPQGTDAETADWLCREVARCLSWQGASATYSVYLWVTNRPDAPQQWRTSVMLDWRYAALNRALREVADQQWHAK